MRKYDRTNLRVLIFNLIIAGVLVLSACGPAATPEPTQDVTLIQTQAAQTVVADITKNAPNSSTCSSSDIYCNTTASRPNPRSEYPSGGHSYPRIR